MDKPSDRPGGQEPVPGLVRERAVPDPALGPALGPVAVAPTPAPAPTELTPEERAIQAFADKVNVSWELVQRRARNAAERLINARCKLKLPMPRTPEELVDCLENMAATPKKFGVFLTEVDKRNLRLFHRMWRAARAAQEKEAAARASGPGLDKSD